MRARALVAPCYLARRAREKRRLLIGSPGATFTLRQRSQDLAVRQHRHRKLLRKRRVCEEGFSIFEPERMAAKGTGLPCFAAVCPFVIPNRRRGISVPPPPRSLASARDDTARFSGPREPGYAREVGPSDRRSP